MIAGGYAMVRYFGQSNGNIDNMAFELQEILMDSEGGMLIQLFITIILIGLTIIYCRFIERRSLSSMGFSKTKFLFRYIKGLGLGFLMFSFAVLICMMTGTLSITTIDTTIPIGLIVLFFIGFMIQGMSEEVFLRGYLMTSLGARTSIIWAIMINSVIFAGLHLLNPNVSFLALANLILFGVFASVYTLRTNNLWEIGAIHSIWNFAQGNIYGIQVSGMAMKASVLKATTIGESALINGGEFGLEGGIAVTIVLGLATAWVLFIGEGKLVKSKDVVDAIEV